MSKDAKRSLSKPRGYKPLGLKLGGEGTSVGILRTILLVMAGPAEKTGSRTWPVSFFFVFLCFLCLLFEMSVRIITYCSCF